MHIHSYPSIYNFGHRAVASLLTGPVYVQEKVALQYKTPARWAKSVQHLKEAGQQEI
jgi:hypothetical protein